jgi:hypothetical protein
MDKLVIALGVIYVAVQFRLGAGVSRVLRRQVGKTDADTVGRLRSQTNHKAVLKSYSRHYMPLHLDTSGKPPSYSQSCWISQQILYISTVKKLDDRKT